MQALWPWYSSGLDGERETIENQAINGTDAENVEDNEGAISTLRRSICCTRTLTKNDGI